MSKQRIQLEGSVKPHHILSMTKQFFYNILHISIFDNITQWMDLALFILNRYFKSNKHAYIIYIGFIAK